MHIIIHLHHRGGCFSSSHHVPAEFDVNAWATTRATALRLLDVVEITWEEL